MKIAMPLFFHRRANVAMLSQTLSSTSGDVGAGVPANDWSDMSNPYRLNT